MLSILQVVLLPQGLNEILNKFSERIYSLLGGEFWGGVDGESFGCRLEPGMWWSVVGSESLWRIKGLGIVMDDRQKMTKEWID